MTYLHNNPLESLLTAKELLQLLENNEAVTFDYTTLEKNYISTLTYSLPLHSVFDRRWDKKIFISLSISNEKILQKKPDLFECAKAFRKDGNRLMRLMASAFGIDLQTLDGLHELKYKKSHKQRGQLNEEWSYFLHGAECRFESKETGQVVEIIVTTNPEFGYLDCYFFYTYMVTTTRFKQLAAYFDDNYMYICKAIDLLVFEGVLIRVPNLAIQRNVIAL